MDQLSKDQEASSQASLSNAIDQIMAHPELISMVASALKVQDTAASAQVSEEKNGSDGNEAFPTSVGNIGNRESSDVLSSLMPMLSKLGSMSSSVQKPHKVPSISLFS